MQLTSRDIIWEKPTPYILIVGSTTIHFADYH